MKGHNCLSTVYFLCLPILVFIPIILLAQDHGFSNENATIHEIPAKTYHLRHLKLEVSFDQSQKMVFGKAALSITPIADSLKQVVLDAVDLKIKSVTINDHQPLDYSENEGKLKIDLDRDYRTDEMFTIAIDYQVQPQAGLYFVQPEAGYPDEPWQVWSQGEMEFNHYWFPCYDFPNDRMTTEMIITVPKGQMAISNGELIEKTENDISQTVTYDWQENIPHSSYLTSIVVGDFFEGKDEWTGGSRTQRVAGATPGRKGIPVNFYVEPQDSDKVARSFHKTVDMIDFFSKKIGIDYPYEKYAQTTIMNFMWGGMENISATTLTRNTLHDRRADLDYSSDGLVAHELAHQWWGDLLTCKNWNNVWLNEAFATYFDALYVEHDKGRDEFIMEMQGNRDRYFQEDSTKYRRPIVYNLYEDASQMFDRHTYQKGAWALHMIRYILGDELWWKAIHHYGEKFAKTTVVTSDFQQAIEEATGKSLDWFFDEWLYKGGYPEYAVSWNWNAQEKSLSLNVEQVQRVDEVTPLFRMPVEIEINGSFGTENHVIEVDQKQETFKFKLPSKPDRVEFDPREQILKKLTFTKSKDELLNQLRYSNYTIGKIRAANWLAKYGDDGEVVQALAHTIAHEKFWGIREEAAKTLRKIKKGESRDALISALQDDKSKVRIAAIKSLAQFKDDDKVEKALLDIFEKDSSYYAEAEAVRSLAKINPETGYNICLQALLKDSYDDVIRKAAFDGFVQLKDPRGIDYALEWAAYGKPLRARTFAIRALGKLAKYDQDRKEEIYQRFSNFLNENHFRIRNAAVMALGDLGNPFVIPQLEKVAAHEYHFRWKEIIDEAIKKINQRNAKNPDGNSMTADSLGTSD